MLLWSGMKLVITPLCSMMCSPDLQFWYQQSHSSHCTIVKACNVQLQPLIINATASAQPGGPFAAEC